MDDKLFYCYSIPLMKFLRNNNLKFICKGHNDRTRRDYWVYQRTEELKVYLDRFTEMKNIAK